ncbi:uncharacterized protein LOC134195363 [Corticium candelabrum]|uniref:uncharacterized protein LOC134195363 n=1 Tax=Corticium candelabrum TaxID=121492 RepID=UPI002E27186E|nr:uncharacterized protein LOC134195363 [Corticium candelabrum]
MLLLQCCYVPNITHLARTVHPDLLVHASTIHDSVTKETFSYLLGYDMVDDRIGIRLLTHQNGRFRNNSFAVSETDSFCCILGQRFYRAAIPIPCLLPIIDSLLSSSTSPISEAIERSVPPEKHISDYLPCAGKVQQRLSSVTASSNAQYLLKNAPTARNAAHLRSTTGKDAETWLNAIPTSEVFAFNSCEFRLASFLHLGLPIAFSRWTMTCNCGALIDDNGYHLLTCKTCGGPIWSHKSISSVWSDCFRGLHIHHRREPRSHYTTTDNRPDIVFFTDIGNNVDLDISLAYPWSSDIFPSSAVVSGAAAERRADRKKEKYSKQQLPGGMIATVTPLVMEHFGA